MPFLYRETRDKKKTVIERVIAARKKVIMLQNRRKMKLNDLSDYGLLSPAFSKKSGGT